MHIHICIYLFVHICIYIYFPLPFCAAPLLSPPWLTLSVRWGDTCAFGCLVSSGWGQGFAGLGLFEIFLLVCQGWKRSIIVC